MSSNLTIPKQFSTRNVLIAIFIGLSVTGYLIYQDFNKESFVSINWHLGVFFWLFMCVVFMALRDIGYMIRLRILTDKKLSWKQCFQVIMVWEFASTLTPSVVGGSSIAMFIINREQVPLGRSTAIVLITALLDELFYIVMVPIAVLAAGYSNLFPVDLHKNILGLSFGVQGIFILGYGVIVFLTVLVSIALLFFPQGFKYTLSAIFSLRFLKRWQRKAIAVGEEVVITSKELKHKPYSFWFNSFLATVLSWTSRFLVINCLLLAFASITYNQHLIIYGRQMVMWVIMLITPTPGSSGVAELLFKGFLNEFAPVSLVGFQAFLWRILSYYPYMLIGVVVLPRWLRRTSTLKTEPDLHKD
jgi:uncharacterized membrane protein YbhN (UPF0104 family)